MVLIVTGIFSALPARDFSGSPLLAGDKETFVGADAKCSEEYAAAMRESGLALRKKRADLLRYKCGFIAPSGTHVEVLAVHGGYSFVRLLDLRYAGRKGWVPASWVKPPRGPSR